MLTKTSNSTAGSLRSDPIAVAGGGAAYRVTVWAYGNANYQIRIVRASDGSLMGSNAALTASALPYRTRSLQWTITGPAASVRLEVLLNASGNPNLVIDAVSMVKVPC